MFHRFGGMSKSTSRIVPGYSKSESFFGTPDPDDRGAERDNCSYIPPWTEPYIIGVAGNSGSGKTSVSQRIIQEINQPWTVLLSFDNFYRPLSKLDKEKAFNSKYDFDTPNALDFDLLYKVVCSLKEGNKTTIPIYSFVKHDRTEKTSTIYGANVIIIEGIYALYDKRLLDLMDLKIFVDTELDVCLSRRLTRDILYRGRDLEGALIQWEHYVKPNAIRFVNPTMSNADLIIPKGLENSVAIGIMIRHVQKQLLLKSAAHLESLKNLGIETFDVDHFPNVTLLARNNHTNGIHSILMNKSSSRSDFIFYFDRMAILIIEEAVNIFDFYSEEIIQTETKHIYKGLKQTCKLFAVSIIRSGDCFMYAISRTFKDISVGKLLIQSDSVTGEPQLHLESLPSNISTGKVIIFDAQIISGAAAIMAIQVLLDQGVKLSNIIFCAYLCTEIGIRRILKVFPNICIVVGKLSSLEGEKSAFNPEGFKDSDWQFRNRFIDNLYFGT